MKSERIKTGQKGLPFATPRKALTCLLTLYPECHIYAFFWTLLVLAILWALFVMLRTDD